MSTAGPPVVVVAKHFILREKADRFAQVFDTFYAQAIKEPGLLAYNVAVNDEKTLYVIFEEYEDVAAQTAHVNTPHFKVFKEAELNPEHPLADPNHAPDVDKSLVPYSVSQKTKKQFL